MKTLEVTDEQYAQLDAVRESLAEDVTYGHVRPRDAVQYLLDAHDGEDLDVTVDASAAESDGAATDGDDSADESGGSVDGDGTSADETAESDGIDDGDETDDGEDEADDAAAPTPTPGGGGDRLSAMMNLLDTHDDKWERADSAETRYVVDLPDGGTEEVQTKDDVKAILFKNY